jgi:lipoprotein NlpI
VITEHSLPWLLHADKVELKSGVLTIRDPSQFIDTNPLIDYERAEFFQRGVVFDTIGIYNVPISTFGSWDTDTELLGLRLEF